MEIEEIKNLHSSIEKVDYLKFFCSLIFIICIFILYPLFHGPFNPTTFVWLFCSLCLLIYMINLFIQRLKSPTVFTLNKDFLTIDFNKQPSIQLPYTKIESLTLSISGRLLVQTYLNSEKTYLLVAKFEEVYRFFQKLATASQIVIPDMSYEEFIKSYNDYVREVNIIRPLLPIFAVINCVLFICFYSYHSQHLIIGIILILDFVIISGFTVIQIIRKEKLSEKYLKFNIERAKFVKLKT